ncbi:MAG TPA: NAD(P)/FAD-dependent oxidoreductase [Jiangellales bacterium]|nr:NAD(P)/FAD-dependent oxidoreductase [Jiangellales bacterium]
MTSPRTRDRYDVVVVGARAGGAATATLLAREGLRVLLLDKARRGSDTLSTLALMRPAVLLLHRWGLLDRLAASGTPPVRRTVFHYGTERVPVDVRPGDGVDALYAPRRTVLDPLLADAAAEAGADVRFEVDVRALLHDDHGRVVGVTGRDAHGRAVEAHAPWVVGADGRRSLVAREVDAPVMHVGSASSAYLVTFVEGLPTDGYEWAFAPGRLAGFVPSSDGWTNVWASVPTLRGSGRDTERTLWRAVGSISPDLAERLAGARRVSPVRGHPGSPALVRRPYGPGWALVGDAGAYRDPATAHGITDAFRDAELLAGALVEVFEGCDPAEAMRRYELRRDAASVPVLEVTESIAALDWDMAGLPDLHRRLSRALKAETEAVLGRAGAAAVA